VVVRYLLGAALLVACVAGATGAGGLLGCASTQHSTSRSEDAAIAGVIARRFAADQRLCPFAISVAVYGHTARLQGKVASEADRQRADKIAREGGASKVEDYLIVDPSAGDAAMC
jgi:osmotically-inducible protein OsmY